MASHRRPILFASSAFAVAVIAACADTGPSIPDPVLRDPTEQVQRMFCQATVAAKSVRCVPAEGTAAGPRGDIFGGQGTAVQLSSTNVAYNAGTELFSFDVTVQNLLNEAIGTPDGVTPDVNGIRVAFHTGPTVTDGTGVITVSNADGTGTFTGTNQPYFQWSEILDKNEISTSKPWILNVPATVNTFSFEILISTEVQPLLVINEVMANPIDNAVVGQNDNTAEWFEIYNAGTREVNIQDFVIADSAASGRRPYHKIASSLVIPSGGYVVLGNNANTTVNGGVTLDYSYGGAMALANSLDALKVARVYGTDTLTIDRTQYSSAATSAQNGISRELKNPALDNSNMDGSNWDIATVTSVYGGGGRGTPKAQNSTYTP